MSHSLLCVPVHYCFFQAVVFWIHVCVGGGGGMSSIGEGFLLLLLFCFQPSDLNFIHVYFVYMPNISDSCFMLKLFSMFIL